MLGRFFGLESTGARSFSIDFGATVSDSDRSSPSVRQSGQGQQTPTLTSIILDPSWHSTTQHSLFPAPGADGELGAQRAVRGLLGI